MSVYIDSSALAKWYINEAHSAEVVEFVTETSPVFISTLTKVEIKSLTARHRREGRLNAESQSRILATFEGDIAAGHLILAPHNVESFLIAESLLGAHPDVPLLTLDALHLGIVQASGIGTLATADKVMARSAEALGMECRTFF